MGFGSIASTQPFVKQGKIRMIAITSAKRSPAAPYIPTIGETVKGYEMTPWNAMFAPRGTPRAVIDRLNRETVAAIKSPQVAERLMGLGYEAAASTPEQLAAHVKVELVRYGKLIRRSGSRTSERLGGQPMVFLRDLSSQCSLHPLDSAGDIID